MTYTESLKSGHIAVWNSGIFLLNTYEILSINAECEKVQSQHEVKRQAKRVSWRVNKTINQMIDSARDL